MPLYEYICDECDTRFEVLRSASDSDEVTCPKCEAPARKLLSLFATGSAGAGRCATGGSGGGSGGG